MENLDKRSETRQRLQQPVSLHTPDAEQPVVGKTRNLSSKGMCVFMTPSPPIGQELMCELPNGQAVRGRVAWVREPDASDLEAWSGVGIEFVDRSKVKVDEIATQISADPFTAEPGPVDVWFDGLEASTRALAARRDGAVELSSTLSFLREGSDVRVLPASMQGQAPLHGKVANVFLRSDGGTPRLVISLALQHEAVTPPSLGEEGWFPEISVDEPVAPRSDEPTASLESAAVQTEVEHDATERNVSPDTAFDGSTEPARGKVGVLTLGAAAVGVAVWALLRAAAPTSVEPAPVVTVTTEPAPVAAPAEPEPIVAAAPVPTAAEPAEAAHPEFVSAELAGKAEKTAEAPQAEPAPVAPTAHSAAPAAVAPPIAAEPAGPTWLPHVVTVGDRPQVVVPLQGSGKGISRFLLDSPPGLAVDLPEASTLVPLRSYLLHDPSFYSLWVRKNPNGKGLQIRLHVTKGIKVGADVVDGNLRFRRKE